VNEGPLDELWTFVYKKEDQPDPIEQLLKVNGDAGVGIAFSPVFKLVPAWLVGNRTPARFSLEISHRWAYSVLYP
jgi:hypothetical protein